MSKWTRSERKRYQEEQKAGIKPDIRPIFLTPEMKRKRKRKAEQVARKLMGR